MNFADAPAAVVINANAFSGTKVKVIKAFTAAKDSAFNGATIIDATTTFPTAANIKKVFNGATFNLGVTGVPTVTTDSAFAGATFKDAVTLPATFPATTFAGAKFNTGSGGITTSGTTTIPEKAFKDVTFEGAVSFGATTTVKDSAFFGATFASSTPSLALNDLVIDGKDVFKDATFAAKVTTLPTWGSSGKKGTFVGATFKNQTDFNFTTNPLSAQDSIFAGANFTTGNGQYIEVKTATISTNAFAGAVFDRKLDFVTATAVTSIGANAFAGATFSSGVAGQGEAQTTITLPNGVILLGAGAFTGFNGTLEIGTTTGIGAITVATLTAAAPTATLKYAGSNTASGFPDTNDATPYTYSKTDDQWYDGNAYTPQVLATGSPDITFKEPLVWITNGAVAPGFVEAGAYKTVPTYEYASGKFINLLGDGDSIVFTIKPVNFGDVDAVPTLEAVYNAAIPTLPAGIDFNVTFKGAAVAPANYTATWGSTAPTTANVDGIAYDVSLNPKDGGNFSGVAKSTTFKVTALNLSTLDASTITFPGSDISGGGIDTTNLTAHITAGGRTFDVAVNRGLGLTTPVANITTTGGKITGFILDGTGNFSKFYQYSNVGGDEPATPQIGIDDDDYFKWTISAEVEVATDATEAELKAAIEAVITATFVEGGAAFTAYKIAFDFAIAGIVKVTITPTDLIAYSGEVKATITISTLDVPGDTRIAFTDSRFVWTIPQTVEVTAAVAADEDALEAALRAAIDATLDDAAFTAYVIAFDHTTAGKVTVTIKPFAGSTDYKGEVKKTIAITTPEEPGTPEPTDPEDIFEIPADATTLTPADLAAINKDIVVEDTGLDIAEQPQ